MYKPLGNGPRLSRPCAEMVGCALSSCFPQLSEAAARILAHHLYRASRAAPGMTAEDAIFSIAEDFDMEPYDMESPIELVESLSNGERLATWMALARRLSNDSERRHAIKSRSDLREIEDAEEDDEGEEGGRIRLPKKFRRAAQRAMKKVKADASAIAREKAMELASRAKVKALEEAQRAQEHVQEKFAALSLAAEQADEAEAAAAAADIAAAVDKTTGAGMLRDLARRATKVAKKEGKKAVKKTLLQALQAK